MDLRNSPIYYQEKHYYIKMYILDNKMERKYVYDYFFTGSLQEIEENEIKKMIYKTGFDYDSVYELTFEVYEVLKVSKIKKKAIAFKEIKTNKEVNKLITTFKYKI